MSNEEKPIYIQSSDRSFIIILDRLHRQALAAVHSSEPSVDSQHEDGVKLGKLYMIQDVIKAYKGDD
jgi:hypothetical protein